MIALIMFALIMVSVCVCPIGKPKFFAGSGKENTNIVTDKYSILRDYRTTTRLISKPTDFKANTIRLPDQHPLSLLDIMIVGWFYASVTCVYSKLDSQLAFATFPAFITLVNRVLW